MFKNYLKTTFRNLFRHKLFSGLNVFGLATGMACSIMIFLWVQDELSFDRFNPDATRIFRITTRISDLDAAVVPPSLAYAVKTQIPAIENATRVKSAQKTITVGTKKFDEKNIYYADSNFLQIFNYPLLKGSSASVFSSPHSIVLTAATAKRYFGSAEGAMGKTIYLSDKGTSLLITGILKDIPSNSHLQPDMLIPMNLYDEANNVLYGWSNFDVYIYLKLKDAVAQSPANFNSINKQIKSIFKQNDKNSTQASFSLQALTDIHLHSHYLLDVPNGGNYAYVQIFALAAIFIILIACINFMNLSTAISGQRAKEVGLRKTIGALRFQLIAQFIGESLFLAFISLLVAIAIVYLMLPLFNQVSSKTISFSPFNPYIFIRLIGITVLTGFLSGSYPAFILSSFNPIKALKGKIVLRSNKSILRNGLVVLQFSISVILIVSTLVIYSQLQYIKNRDIGFDKENLLYMKIPDLGEQMNKKDGFKTTLAQYPGISNYTFVDELPTNLTASSQLTWRGMPPGTQVMASRLRVDDRFIETFGIHMAAGRFFSKDFGDNEAGYVVNETALKVMALNVTNAIGKLISISLEDKEAPIIGVVKDFNFKPLQQPIEPLVIKTNFSGGYVVMRTTPASIQKMISSLQQSFHRAYGDYPFTYGFINEELSKLYVTEQRMEKLFNIFSILSLVISCMGLFGLATFAAQQRIKEIGVRKVLGASEASIVALLSKDFIKLVLVSIVIAFPVAWWASDKWLQSFAYRIGISWWLFLIAGVAAMLIAQITVSFQSIKAALANPVKSLRSE